MKYDGQNEADAGRMRGWDWERVHKSAFDVVSVMSESYGSQICTSPPHTCIHTFSSLRPCPSFHMHRIGRVNLNLGIVYPCEPRTRFSGEGKRQQT